jgi:hypothetical protein
MALTDPKMIDPARVSSRFYGFLLLVLFAFSLYILDYVRQTHEQDTDFT